MDNVGQISRTVVICQIQKYFVKKLNKNIYAIRQLFRSKWWRVPLSVTHALPVKDINSFGSTRN